MSARTKARKRAVDAVFAADLRKISPLTLINEVAELTADRQNQDAIFGYAKQIVQGIVDNHNEIDDLLDTYSQGWAIDRMPNVDRAILRVAVWEIMFNDEVPDAVAINEAVEMAKELSTDESGAFINGLLTRISATKAAQ
ncbi:transcription antitermination factor NusB [Rhodoluna sp.]|uniref:transcription antitermination factor NusB n=1 Tax=Rhodoluna sp. TaxID=1969481 RepID=UPI0025FBB76C|nr:transcription antitermination factor NusB [Rhodoluna sp.]